MTHINILYARYFYAIIGLIMAIIPHYLHGQEHGFALWGQLKYGANVQHTDYVNPNAPKKGLVRMDAAGTFDNFNSFIVQGNSPQQLSLIYDTLMSPSLDEIASNYGRVAKAIYIDKAAKTIAFTLRKQARFSDNMPVTSADIVFSFNQLTTHGSPLYKLYYNDVVSAAPTTINGDDAIIFTIANIDNNELPLILGQLPILPKHYWQDKDFSKPLQDVPIGSGPYKVKNYAYGRHITYELRDDYWGKNIPIMQGVYNFKELRFDYFRNRSIAFEAFKAGDLDIWNENSSRRWATAYNGQAFDDGSIIKQAFEHDNVATFQAIYMNTRRPIFSNPKTREAMQYLWDFAWVNKNIMYNSYTRTRSLFDNNPLAANGAPTPREQAFLQTLPNVPPHILAQGYTPSISDGSGNNRANLKKALTLLKEAGYVYHNKKLIHQKTQQPFSMELVLRGDTLAPHMQPLKQAIERIGGDLQFRVYDDSVWVDKINHKDFDMVIIAFGQSDSPGNEQYDMWGSIAANKAGSRNLAGAQNPAIDSTIDHLVKAKTYDELTFYAHILDRLVMGHYYVIPMYHATNDRYAWWNKFAKPAITPTSGVSTSLWWYK